jgi:probable phosphoglycerate mutase
MSDLQCPATLLIARHGEAGPEADGWPSDDGSALTDDGRAQVRLLVAQVRQRRIAEVVSSTMRRAVQSAELAAPELGVRCTVTDGLQEFPMGDPDGAGPQDPRAHRVLDAWVRGDLSAAMPGMEDGHAVVRRFRQALETIADSHRGETVLVFSHGGVMSLAIPRLAVNLRAESAVPWSLPHCVAAEVEVDADGWRVVSWPVPADPDAS